MGFVTGNDNFTYETVLFIIYACIGAILFLFQIFYQQKMRTLPVFVLPFISFCICYKNVILFRGDHLLPSSDAAKAAYVFDALIPSCLLISCFELPYRLHKARTVHFLWIPFEEGEYMSKEVALFTLWCVRFLSAGIFVARILASFEFVGEDSMDAGVGGYASLHRSGLLTYWLYLVPNMIVGLVSFVMSLLLRK
jgi:hypothetical protein